MVTEALIQYDLRNRSDRLKGRVHPVVRWLTGHQTVCHRQNTLRIAVKREVHSIGGASCARNSKWRNSCHIAVWAARNRQTAARRFTMHGGHLDAGQ